MISCRRSRTVAALIVGSFLIGFCPTPLAAQGQDKFTPPWTQEKKIPKEVKDKEKEKPTAWCAGEAIYIDPKTGTTTTIRYKQGPPAKFTVIIQELNKPERRITYDLTPGKETRTEKVGTDPAKTTQIDPNKDLYEPAKTTTAQAPEGSRGDTQQKAEGQKTTPGKVETSTVPGSVPTTPATPSTPPPAVTSQT